MLLVMSRPLDQRLYDEVVRDVRRRVSSWPSAYASGQVVREYKRRGGRYEGSRRRDASLSRWFKEDWRNVCERDSSGSYPTCDAGSRRMPYCRPTVRVSKRTPRTVDEMSHIQLRSLCEQKRRGRRASAAAQMGRRHHPALPRGTRFVEGPRQYKYTAELPDGRRVHFGHRDYEHYRDAVPRRLGGGLWSHLDHGDERRRASYRSRHGAVRTRIGELAHRVELSPAWFSYYFLW